MSIRKGLGKGKGTGYKNLMGNDSKIHSQSAKGVKQPQKVNGLLDSKISRVKDSNKSLIKKFNKTKDKSLLPNNGLATKNILFQKNGMLIGTMKNYNGRNVPIRLDIKIEETDLSTQALYNRDGELLEIGNTKKTTDLKEVSSYKHLSISGNIGNEQAGQIQDTLKKGLNDPDFKFKNKEGVKEILEVWENHHLNDLKAGTNKQQKALENWKERPEANSYDADVNYLKSKKLYSDRNYKFGHAWLVEDLPVSTMSKLNNSIKKIQLK